VEGVLRLKRWEQFVEGALRLKRWEQFVEGVLRLKRWEQFVEGVLRLKRWEQFVEGALRLKRWEQLRRSHFDLKKCGRGKKVFTNFLWNAHIGLEVYINNMSRIWCVLTAVQLKQSRINRILRNAQWSTME